MSSHTSRNAPCPCGSGKKNKNCCGRSASFLNAGQKRVIVLSALVIAGLVAAVMIFANNEPPLSPTLSPTAFPTGTQSSSAQGRPPGPAPAGKVWSPEHGHWHDASGATPTTIPAGQPFGQPSVPGTQFTPQPPGPAPAGKVWSTQHGHWHDAAVTGAAPTGSGTGP